MIPARLLEPWEVLEMDTQDMKTTSGKGNRYLLVVVDRASKLLTVFPLPTKEATGVSRELLGLLLTFGLPLSIRCDPGDEFVADVMQRLCRWLRVSLDHGPTNHPQAQGAVERLGGGFKRPSSSCVIRGPIDGTTLSQWQPGSTASRRTKRCRETRRPTAFSSVGSRASHIDAVTQALDGTSFG